MELIERIINAVTQLHPLHPMIVHFPIALSGAALLFIIIAMIRKDKNFEKYAYANMVLTVFATLAAGLTGMYDNMVNYEGDAANTDIKFILAIVMFAVTLITVVIRMRNPNIFNSRGRVIYISGYFISFIIVTVLAFLGAVILYGF
jgi:uncharacterized membrane protein